MNTVEPHEKNADMLKFLKQNNAMLEGVRRRAGIDHEKVQKVATAYLQIAVDNQVNYNELSLALGEVKNRVLHSLNIASISSLPDIISEAAKV